MSMAKISMVIPDAVLLEIDAEAAGNRTAFMVAASVERARRLKRERIDHEIATALTASAEHDAVVYADWEVAIADGLE